MLIAHKGAAPLSLEDLRAIETPETYERTGFTPIPHATLFDTIVDRVDAVGLQMDEIRHYTRFDGEQYFGICRVKSLMDGVDGMIGWRNGHGFRSDNGTLMRAVGAGMVAGRHVTVCDNMLFTGEIKFSLVHTRTVTNRLQVAVAKALVSLNYRWDSVRDEINRRKSVDVTPDMAKVFVYDAAVDSIIPPSAVVTVVDEFLEPSHREHGTGSAWALEQSFTEFFKRYQIHDQTRRGLKLDQMMRKHPMVAEAI